MWCKGIRARTDALLPLAAAILLILSMRGLVVRAQDVPTQTISGFVVDASGNPVGGAQVQVVDIPEIITFSGDDGSYALDGVPAGDHLVSALTVAPDNSLTAIVTAMISLGGDEPVNLDLAVEPVVPGDGGGATDQGQTPPQDQSQPQDQAPPVPTDTPTPIPTDTPTPIPEATATPSPTPSPTEVPLALLSGTVKNDQGLPAPSGSRVQMLDLPLQAGTRSDGGYTINGVPLGRHFVYAMDAVGKVSDTVEIAVNGGNE